jgi:hypothetical protein
MTRFTFEYDITATIDAELLAEPTLLDFTDPGCASPAVAYNAEPTFCCERRENE